MYPEKSLRAQLVEIYSPIYNSTDKENILGSFINTMRAQSFANKVAHLI